MEILDPGSPGVLAAGVSAGFLEAFGDPPTVVGRAPGRVNLIGEHTDYNAGLCLPIALPHATYAALRLRDDDRIRLVSRQADQPWEGTLRDLGPGSPTGWPAYLAGVIWALRHEGLPVGGIDCLIDSTVPVGAGLSSSAAIECALAVAVIDALGLPLDDDERERLVTACKRAETEVAGAPTGGLDQTVSLFAEPGSALLLDFDSGARRQVRLPLAEAGLSLLVIDTRVSHALVDGGYAARRADCEAAAAHLGVPTLRQASLAALTRLADDRLLRRARHVVTEIQRVSDTVAALESGDWASVGWLFNASHISLRDDYEVSCAELDLAVATALAHGALGARMTGGGFGGSAVALVESSRVTAVAEAVAEKFERAGHAAPAFLAPDPSGGAAIQA